MARLTNIDTDIRVLRGDSATLTLGLTKPDDAGVVQPFPVADTTHELWVTVKGDTAMSDSDAWVRKRLTSSGDMAVRTPPNDWIVDVRITADETALIPPGDYWYDAQVKVLASGEVRTMVIGRFIVLPDVTRAH